MNQLGLPMLGATHASAEALARVGRRQLVLRRVAVNMSVFRADFLAWIEKNLHVWERFDHESSRIWNAGRRHYSARTIGEVLRHESALAADNDGEWKLNDHRWPDLARLYLLMYPEREGFFEFRGRGAQ